MLSLVVSKNSHAKTKDLRVGRFSLDASSVPPIVLYYPAFLAAAALFPEIFTRHRPFFFSQPLRHLRRKAHLFWEEIIPLRRHLDDIKMYVPEFVPEFIPEFVPEFDLNTDFYSGTNSGMNSGTNFFYVV